MPKFSFTCSVYIDSGLDSYNFFNEVKKYFIILFLFGCTKTEIIHTGSTVALDAKTLALKADTTINTIWDGGGRVYNPVDAQGKVHMLHGGGVFQNWVINGPLTAQLFDTSIILKNIQSYGIYFSAAWLGAKETNTDNWWNIQKSINTCMDNSLLLYLPGSVYKHSKRIDVSKMVNGVYQQVELFMYGNSSYWDAASHKGTTLQYTGTTDGAAINFQLNKGSILKYIQFNGMWKSPGGSDSSYYNLSEANYKDQSGYNLSDNYVGIAIDYFYDGHSRSGSTGISMDNISIGGFAQCLSFSHNKITQNDDNISIDHIQIKDCKWGIVTGQPQEKGNSIDHIYSWGSCYNVLKDMGAGSYSYTVANIAGRCIEPVQASIWQWFSSDIHSWKCESIARVCTISAGMPFTFSDCNFDLITTISKQRNVIISNSNYVSFTGCTIRYYDGVGGDIWVKGTAAFNNCSFYMGQVIYK